MCAGVPDHRASRRFTRESSVLDLGMIKGNQGNQIYDIPADVDLAAYPTVDLWCVQFAVSFGAAALTPS